MADLISHHADVAIGTRRGHANPSIALTVYAHPFSNTKEGAAEIVEAAFAGVPASEGT